MTEPRNDRPFADLPSALVDEVLQRTESVAQGLMGDLERVREGRARWRERLLQEGLLRREHDLPYVPIPTTCGVDGSYAVERLLATDLVAAAAVAVEGLTPPSEKRYWPEPRHEIFIDTEVHDPDTGTVLRAGMSGMELSLAANAPHDLVFLDGSLTTPFIHMNQALNKVHEAAHLRSTGYLLQQLLGWLQSYRTVLLSTRTDQSWIGVPKYTTRREFGHRLGWPESYDDRALLTRILEPGEFTQPHPLQQPAEPWHLNVTVARTQDCDAAGELAEDIASALRDVQILYYRPQPWIPALRLEIARPVAENAARLAQVLHGARHQCGAPGMLEPYPLYLADRMVKHLGRAVPAFRQVTSQKLAEVYSGDIGDVFLALHAYRTESGG